MKQFKVILLIGFSFLLTGCWDSHEIEEIEFATSIGIDYRDEKYLIYAQTLDFTNVAKQESGKPAEPAPLYIGKGSGHTIIDAIDDLYRHLQQPMKWPHRGAIIYPESVLQQGLEKVEQGLKRYGEFRYTPWMFGTKGSIEKILSVTGFFHLPPIYTILYNPTNIYDVYSYIEPMRMHKFISIYKEPGGTVLLPSIDIDETDWKETVQTPKPKITLKINGVFPVNQGKYKEWLSYRDIIGLRWLQTATNHTPVEIIEDNKTKGIVRITDPSFKINVVKNGESVHFNIIVEAKGALRDLQEPLSSKKIEVLVAKQIEKEIRSTYKNSINKKVDVYNLKNLLFHHRVKPSQLKNYPLTTDSLKEIKVKFHLESRGVFN